MGMWIPARAEPLSLVDFAAFARSCAPDVAVSTLAAIARTESHFDPLALHDNTAGVVDAPESLADAASVASRLIAGGHSVDLGLMQVNNANLPLLGLTVADAFDPCRSLAAGATILTAGYAGGVTHAAQQAALQVAISRYNTGDAQRGFANGYVREVEAANAIMVPALDLVAHAAPSELPAAVTVSLARPPSWDVFASGSADVTGVMVFPSSKESK